jgi:hypothetical protein
MGLKLGQICQGKNWSEDILTYKETKGLMAFVWSLRFLDPQKPSAIFPLAEWVWRVAKLR